MPAGSAQCFNAYCERRLPEHKYNMYIYCIDGWIRMDPSLQNFAQTNYEIGASFMRKSRNPSHIQLHKSNKRNLLHTRT